MNSKVEQEIDISKASVETLKSMVYDRLVFIKKAESEIGILESELKKKLLPQVKVPPPNKEAEVSDNKDIK